MESSDQVEQLTLFQPDSLANPLATPAAEKALTTSVISGRKLFGYCKTSTPLGLLGKMSLDSSVWQSQMGGLLWKAEPYSVARKKTYTKRYLYNKKLCFSDVSVKTLKTSAIKSNRLLFRLRLSVRHTSANESSFWATPNTMDHMGQRSEGALIRQATTTRKGRTKPANLREQVDERTMRLWGTPTASSYKGSSPYGSDRWKEEVRRGNIKGQVMEPGNRGQLNPEWVEILMNFPPGWTEVD